MGKTGDALAACRRSETLLAGLAGLEPSARAPLGACRLLLGYLHSRTGRGDECLAAYRQARADYEALAAAPGATNSARSNLASVGMRLGLHLQEMSKPSEAEAEFRKADCCRFQELADEDSAASEFRDGLAYGHELVDMMLLERARSAEGEAEYRRAQAQRQKLVDDDLAVAKYRSELAQNHNGFGIVLGADMVRTLRERAGDRDEALEPIGGPSRTSDG